MNFNDFKKCDVTPNSKGKGKYVRLCKTQHSLTLSTALAREADIKQNDRVDLYRCNNVFAIKKAKAGCLHFNGGHSKQTTLLIRSVSAYLEVAPFVNGKTILPAWVEDGVIYFTADENVINENYDCYPKER